MYRNFVCIIPYINAYDENSNVYMIDSNYRWFYYSYDKIEGTDRFVDVRERVENIYSNTYLQNLIPKWNMNFTDKTMQAIGLLKQDDFYKHYLKGYEEKNNQIIVIISDAFRYKCGKERMQILCL